MDNPGSNVQRFDPSDTSTVCSRWKKWKRGFEIFLDVNNVTVPARKRSYLLHFAGSDVQDIFFNLRGEAEPQIPAGSDIYQESIKLLDDYFLPLKCLPRERHIFRNLAQAPDESIEKFVLRLREQGTLCEYGNWLEENIKEQIFEKGSSDHLRAKILTKANMTLAETVELGRSLETIAKHQKNLIPEEEINRVGSTKGECYRCGQTGHYASSEDCPARNQTCDRCQLVGHFKRCCNTKLVKPRNKLHQRTTRSSKGVRQTANKEPSNRSQSEDSSGEEENYVDYVFAIGPAAAEKVSCSVGGVELLWMVDSGTGVNVISEAAWKFLKMNKVKVSYQTAHVTKKLMAYGNQPLELMGMFTASIGTRSSTISDRIFVVKEGGANLLGRSAATKLEILKIDSSICSVQYKGVVGQIKEAEVPPKVKKEIWRQWDRDMTEPAQLDSPWISHLAVRPRSGDQDKIQQCANKVACKDSLCDVSMMIADEGLEELTRPSALTYRKIPETVTELSEMAPAPELAHLNRAEHLAEMNCVHLVKKPDNLKDNDNNWAYEGQAEIYDDSSYGVRGSCLRPEIQVLVCGLVPEGKRSSLRLLEAAIVVKEGGGSVVTWTEGGWRDRANTSHWKQIPGLSPLAEQREELNSTECVTSSTLQEIRTVKSVERSAEE